MATRRKDSDTQQLDFFAASGKSYETIDPIWTDGRETLARTLPETGPRPGSERTIAPDAPRSRGEDQGRNGHVATGTDKTGQNRGASPPPSLGNGAGEIHFTSARGLAVDDAAVSHQDAGKIKNLNNYRITDADRIGEGSLKQKFSQNLDAIRTLRQIEAERRPATPEEKAVLVKYVGWGSLPAAFAKLPEGEPSTQLAELLTAEELKSARATTLNAHYTSPLIIRAMYQAAQRFGFQAGDILEPACGIGHFIGLMPDEMRRRSSVTGIEIDPLTARIANVLYPDADIREQPFEKSKLTDESFDLSISNVPFGDYTVHDPRWNEHKFSIHDYFFAAALEKVRPGGLLLFITSRHTLDKKDSTLRELLGTRAELLGAIRLPNNAFKRNAGAEVTTDIVMLRKLRTGESPGGPAWKMAAHYQNDQNQEFFINEYFVSHPEMMLGKMKLARGMYRENDPELAPDGRDLGGALIKAVERLPQNIYEVQAQVVSQKTIDPGIPAPSHLKPNAYCVNEDGRLCLNEDSVLQPLDDLPAETRARIRRLIDVRDAVRDCLRSQLDGSSESQVIEVRGKLNAVYDRFISRFGPINARVNQNAFDADPDLPLLLSLEHYNEETNAAAKATIFRERTIHHKQPIQSAGSPKEALLISLNEKGCVDLEHMAGLLARPAPDFLPDLKGMIFLNPETKQWEPEDQYLSGNIREKLVAANSAIITEVRFHENVQALKSVLPTDLPATEIDVRLGAAWLPPQDVQQFIHELLGIQSGVEVGHIHVLGSWHVTGNWEAKVATANTTDWGTNRYTALELIEETLNLKTPTVYDYVDKKPVVNAQDTEAAREKQERIKERFGKWIWTDDERRDRLVRLYNDMFNHSRVRTFNGEHLTLPGASSAIQLQLHQKAGVWRILQTDNTLLGHVVGAGKTFTMVAAAMELKRLGLARKPLFAVPNHMLGQFSTELLMLYPGANILVAGKEDFEAQNRKKLFSRIATGNWDAIIVTHSGFERIPLAHETQVRFFEEQLDELEKIKREHANPENRRLVKEIEKAKKRLEAKLESLAADHKKDNTLTFEELGIDRLFVDEAHYFKNLFYISKMTRIAGLPQTASERAFDMYLKVRHIQSVNNGGGIVFATGTPIANSMAEMFTMQRYLQPDDLKKHNLHHFDSWAATFGEPVTAMELSPDGAGYRLNTRFARFINVPELMQIFRQTADVQTAQMLNLPRPKLEGEKAAVRNAPASAELKEFVESLAKRAEALKNGRVDPRVDNMLKITTEGRKAALDLRLMKPHLPDDPQSKVNLAVENIHRIWAATSEDRLTQLVFCDLSTPQDRGFSVYRDMADKLKRLGVPESEIAFIQDFDADHAKLALFRSVRAGKIRILFGSTQKMGSGTNVQERLIALHHLDAPWRPADVEQREGRILRQGNKNPSVQIYRYVTEGSFDAYMWQTLETKAKFIAQVMTGDMTVRRLEDMDSTALTYAEVKAIASGNPLVIEKAQVDAELIRLTRLRSAHAEEQYRIRSNLRHTREEVEKWTERLTNLREDLEVRQDTAGDKFRIELDKQVLDNRGVAGELLIRRAEKTKTRFGEDIRIGRFAGFDLFIRSGFNDTVELVLCGQNSYSTRITDTALGTIRSLESVVQAFEERVTRLETDIRDSGKRAVELEVKVGASFEKEERYHHLVKRQSEIEEQLDLTKNQAPSQMEDIAPESIEETVSSKIAPRAKQKRSKKVGIHV
jgi:N12 class adenine-specific DNA methylase/adenine-specific DNA methylase